MPLLSSSPSPMFEKLRQGLHDALRGATDPADRRAVIAEMKSTLVRARVGVADLRDGAERTRARLEAERRELETVRRRRRLAEEISDHETVAVADRYERQHVERVEVLERKLEAEERDMSLAEAEVAEMLVEFKQAAAGQPSAAYGSGAGGGQASAAAREADEAIGERDPLRDSLDDLERRQTRAARDAAAAEQLAALKRRMGR